jgi:hypothetical protein
MQGVYRKCVFPVLYLSDICVGSKCSTWPNILGHQLRRIDCALSRITRLPGY